MALSFYTQTAGQRFITGLFTDTKPVFPEASWVFLEIDTGLVYRVVSGVWTQQNPPPGFTIGQGGTVTQLTSKSTAVTLNKLCGRITMHNAALAAGAEVAFTLTNSMIAATDVVLVNVQSIGTLGAYLVGIGAVSAGSCSITVSNASAASLSQAIVLNFVVIKSVIL